MLKLNGLSFLTHRVHITHADRFFYSRKLFIVNVDFENIFKPVKYVNDACLSCLASAGIERTL